GLAVEPRDQCGELPIVVERQEIARTPADPIPAVRTERLVLARARDRRQPGVRQPVSAPAPRRFSRSRRRNRAPTYTRSRRRGAPPTPACRRRSGLSPP